MTIVYRTAGAWGGGKGANLTAAEVDGNFYDHESRIATIEGSPPTPNNIADISISGSVITVTMDDASTFNLTVPVVTWRWMGDWVGATAYAKNDIIVDSLTGFVYLVLEAHTSDPTTFDPLATVGGTTGGDPLYQSILEVAATGGGVAGVVTDSGTTINPTLGQANYLFTLDYYVAADYTEGKNRIAAVLPLDSTVAFDIGTQLHFVQYGNQIHCYGAGGVTVEFAFGRQPYSRDYLSMITATKVATNHWYLSGDLEEDRAPIEITGTTYTLQANHLFKYLRCTNAAGCDVTVPVWSTSRDLPVGAEYNFRQCASGTGAEVTITAATGVTINAKAGSSLSTVEQGSVITLKKVATDVWDLFGDDV